MRKKLSAILIDGSNNHAATKALGFEMDYDKLKLLPEFGEILFAYYFTALPPKEEHSSVRTMCDYLDFNGWNVIQKPTKEFTDPRTGYVKKKGNMDMELGITAIEIAPHVTDIHLFAGDGDYRCLVEYLQRKFGVRVTAWSTLLTHIEGASPMINDELRRQVNDYKDLANYKDALIRPERTPAPRKFLNKRAAA